MSRYYLMKKFAIFSRMSTITKGAVFNKLLLLLLEIEYCFRYICLIGIRQITKINRMKRKKPIILQPP